MEPIPRNAFLLNFTASIMLGHGRPVLTNYVAVLAIFFASVIAVLALPGRNLLADNAIATESLPIAWQDDAELTDVCFVDRNTGWAVGAQGVILRTTDGGKTWLQPNDVSISAVQQQVNESHGKLPLSQKLARIEQGPRARLSHRNVVADASRQEIRVRFESVHFVDPIHGWAAGGYNVPWMDRSRGLIMRTRDGGKTWHRIERLTIPRVKNIHFTNRQLGWAFGEANALHPDGIYFTHDGGSTWSGQSSTRMNTWLAGQQVGGSFVLIDQDGRLGLVTGGNLKRPALFGCSREDRITCLTMQDERNGFAVGQDGLVLKTTDGGNLWKRWSIDSGISGSIRCMTMSQQSLFLAPVSGGLVRVNISDQAVQRIDLPTSVPIQTIQFVDGEAGFAVGDCGTILSTVDGGQNWRKQRGGHGRLAILFVARHATDVSLPLMAYNAGEESRLCGTFLMEEWSTHRDAATQAFERVGSVVNGRAGVMTEAGQTQSLVSAIRAFKPLAIVCCHDQSSKDRYQDAIALQKRVQDSIELAADATAAGDRRRPWQVQRLISSDLAGSVRLDSRRMMPSMGLTVSDQLAVSRTLLGQAIRGKTFSNWRVTHVAKNRPMKGNDLLSGIARQGAGIPVRKRRTALGNLNRLSHALARNKQSERLLKQNVETDEDLVAWRQGLLNVMATTEENVAGLWLTDLAQQYLEAGHLKMVDLTLETLTTYLSDHAFAPAANAWLTIKRSQDFHSARAASDVNDGSAGQSQALEPFMRLTQYDPSLVLEPAWQWVELNLLARSSGLRSVEPKIAQMARLRFVDHPDQAFVTLAQQELAMLRSSNDSLAEAELREEMDFLQSSFTEERPKLDGHLDDELWKTAREQGQVATFEMVSAEKGQGADEIIFGHDDQFFYGAIHCRKILGRVYRQQQGTRTRDPDLSQQDRVQLVIDPGLNFCGAIKLTLDYRGRVSESKLAGKNWNPDWFVAAAQDDDTWNVEFAIPMTALSQRAPDQPIHQADAASRGWGVKVCRIVEHRQAVWQGAESSGESSGEPSVELTGLQASLKPNPAGFRRLLFTSNPKLQTRSRDPFVRQTQYQLESNAEANGESNADPNSDYFPVAPQVPNLDGSNGAVR